MPHTFLIADLAGFTALTEAHGDELAADVAEAFIDGMRALLRGHEAHEVKSMGDAILAHLTDADRALCLAECVIGDLGSRHGALGVRVGVHTGPAVSRGGDWFGATVNITARVADQAQADQALVTSATLTAASDGGAAHRTRPLGPRRLRHVSRPVEVHALEPPTRLHGGLVVDPVCRMAVDPADRGRAYVTAERTGTSAPPTAPQSSRATPSCTPSASAASHLGPRDATDTPGGNEQGSDGGGRHGSPRPAATTSASSPPPDQHRGGRLRAAATCSPSRDRPHGIQRRGTNDGRSPSTPRAVGHLVSRVISSVTVSGVHRRWLASGDGLIRTGVLDWPSPGVRCGEAPGNRQRTSDSGH